MNFYHSLWHVEQRYNLRKIIAHESNRIYALIPALKFKFIVTKTIVSSDQFSASGNPRDERLTERLYLCYVLT